MIVGSRRSWNRREGQYRNVVAMIGFLETFGHRSCFKHSLLTCLLQPTSFGYFSDLSLSNSSHPFVNMTNISRSSSSAKR
jgi:hypothetical protein